MDLGNIVVITNRNICYKYNGGKSPEQAIISQIRELCKHNPKFIVLREKDLPENEYKSLFLDVLKICEASEVKLLLHNYIDIALELGYRNIHMPLWKLDELSKDDHINDFHRFIKDNFDTVGVSIHNKDELELAMELGATYVTAGHIFATDCKKGLPPKGVDFLKEMCDLSKVPVYAIGGISFDNMGQVIKQGALGGCMMSSLMRREILL